MRSIIYIYLCIASVGLFSCNNDQQIQRFFEKKKDTLCLDAYKYIKRHLPPEQLNKWTKNKDLLIKDISLAAHTARESVESGQIPVSYFYEYILPITLLKEPVENWREPCYTTYQHLRHLPFQALCDTLNFEIKRNYKFTLEAPSYMITGWKELKTSRTGDCFHIAKILTYELRAIGIPASIDLVFGWGNTTGAHCWTVAYTQGKMKPFMETQEEGVTLYSPFIVYENKKNKALSIYRYPAKVYRKTFSENREIKELQAVLDILDTPLFLKDTHLKDVSNEYFETINLVLDSLSSDLTQQVVYLATYSNNWEIAAATRYTCNAPPIFNQVNPGLLYMPSFYKSHRVIPAGAPFIIDSLGINIKLIPDHLNLQTIVVRYLYPLIMDYSQAWGHIDELPEDYLEELPNGKYRSQPNNGETYILYYWKQNTWKAIGKTKGKNNQLTYENMPAHALFMLGDEKGKYIGRPFTVESETIQWW